MLTLSRPLSCPHRPQEDTLAAAMGLRGVRVLTFSGMEMKAFGSFYYEIKKKVMWHATNIGSTWNNMIPIMLGTYLLVKWAEGKYEAEQRSHRD